MVLVASSKPWFCEGYCVVIRAMRGEHEGTYLKNDGLLSTQSLNDMLAFLLVKNDTPELLIVAAVLRNVLETRLQR